MNRKLAGDAVWVAFALAAVAGVVTMVRHERRAVAPVPSVSAFERVHVADPEPLSLVGGLLGKPTAPIKLVEFADFQCPFCRALHGALKQLRLRHPDDIAIVYRQYPLTIHPFARTAAIASECAAQQGQFASFADVLFTHQELIGVVPWEVLAARAGIIDTVAFYRCRNESKAMALVDADIAAGSRLGITGTPTLVIGDEMLIGAVPLDTLETLIAKRLPRRARR